MFWDWTGLEPVVALWVELRPIWYSYVVYPYGMDGTVA